MTSSSDQTSSSIQGPQGFRILGLRYAYNTSSHDFAREFFISLRNDVQAVVVVKCLDEGIDVPQVHQTILLTGSTGVCETLLFMG